MPSLVIKNLPKPIHDRLKTDAKLNRRSVTQEAIVQLERSLGLVPAIKIPKTIKTLKPISADRVVQSIREVRDRSR